MLQKPDRDEWGTGLDAMQVALQLEKTVNQSLLDLHKVADSHKDAQVKRRFRAFKRAFKINDPIKISTLDTQYF